MELGVRDRESTSASADADHQTPDPIGGPSRSSRVSRETDGFMPIWMSGDVVRPPRLPVTDTRLPPTQQFRSRDTPGLATGVAE